MSAWFGLIVILLFSVTASAAEVPPVGKLPRTALPLHYALTFRIDPAQAQFSGTAEIRVRLVESTGHVWMHGKALDVREVEVIDAAGKVLVANYSVVDADTGVVRVDFGKPLPAQKVTLRFDYRAPFNRQLEGIYRAEHKGKSYVVSQMEPISARFAFPSFDEPSFKTTFDLVLEIPAAATGVANTPQVSEEKIDNGMKRLRFRTTPPLPTYLIALGVGPWDIKAGSDISPNKYRKTPVPLRGIAAAGEGARIEEMLAATPQIVTALEDYFGYGYAFGKLDLLAAPDFSAGAMENPGLIVFRDWLVLLDASSPVSSRRNSFNVNAHELAHQWFGDTVTMPWWDDIWLNEAFATWMQSKITQQLRPDYRADLDSIEGAQYAMRADSLASARRIRQPIGDNGDIEGAFDSITYQKGAAVLQMFEAWIGPDAFRTGIRKYMRDHAFATAAADDLVAALAAASDQGERLERAMKTFLDQPGMPLVSAALECRDGKAIVALSQQRYLPLGSTAEARQQWGVPVCVRLGRGKEITTQCSLFDKAQDRLVLHGDCPDWYLPNAEGRGYYQFTMPTNDLATLTDAAAMLTDREQLVYADAIAAGFHRGDVEVASVLAAMERLAPSKVRQVAIALIPSFKWIRDFLGDETTRPALDAFATRLYIGRMRALGYAKRTGEAQDSTLLRGELVHFLALDVRVPEVRAELLKRAKNLLAPGQQGHLTFAAVDADLLGTALAVAVQELGMTATDALIAELGRQSDPALRNAMVAALGATLDPALADRMRDFALTDAVKLGEVARMMEVNRERPENRAGYWAWLQRRFDGVLKRTPAFAQNRLPENAATGWCEEGQIQAIDAFFSPKLGKIIGGAQGLARAREAIGLCAAQRRRHGAATLAAWVQAHSIRS